jgi:hypothetical protein
MLLSHKLRSSLDTGAAAQTLYSQTLAESAQFKKSAFYQAAQRFHIDRRRSYSDITRKS